MLNTLWDLIRTVDRLQCGFRSKKQDWNSGKIKIPYLVCSVSCAHTELELVTNVNLIRYAGRLDFEFKAVTIFSEVPFPLQQCTNPLTVLKGNDIAAQDTHAFNLIFFQWYSLSLFTKSMFQELLFNPFTETQPVGLAVAPAVFQSFSSSAEGRGSAKWTLLNTQVQKHNDAKFLLWQICLVREPQLLGEGSG